MQTGFLIHIIISSSGASDSTGKWYRKVIYEQGNDVKQNKVKNYLTSVKTELTAVSKIISAAGLWYTERAKVEETELIATRATVKY